MEKEQITEMYNKQLRGIELNIVSNKIHIFANILQTLLLLLIATKL